MASLELQPTVSFARFLCSKYSFLDIPINKLKGWLSKAGCEKSTLYTLISNDSKYAEPPTTKIIAPNGRVTYAILITLPSFDVFTLVALFDGLRNKQKCYPERLVRGKRNITFPWDNLVRARRVWELAKYFGVQDYFEENGRVFEWLDESKIEVMWGGRHILMIHLTLKKMGEYSNECYLPYEATDRVDTLLGRLEGLHGGSQYHHYIYRWEYEDTLKEDEIKEIVDEFVKEVEICFGTTFSPTQITYPQRMIKPHSKKKHKTVKELLGVFKKGV